MGSYESGDAESLCAAGVCSTHRRWRTCYSSPVLTVGVGVLFIVCCMLYLYMLYFYIYIDINNVDTTAFTELWFALYRTPNQVSIWSDTTALLCGHWWKRPDGYGDGHRDGPVTRQEAQTRVSAIVVNIAAAASFGDSSGTGCREPRTQWTCASDASRGPLLDFSHEEGGWGLVRECCLQSATEAHRLLRITFGLCTEEAEKRSSRNTALNIIARAHFGQCLDTLDNVDWLA